MNIFPPAYFWFSLDLQYLNNFTDIFCISLYSKTIVAYLSDPILVWISLQVWINMLLIGSLQSEVYVLRSVWVLLYCVSLVFKKFIFMFVE